MTTAPKSATIENSRTPKRAFSFFVSLCLQSRHITRHVKVKDITTQGTTATKTMITNASAGMMNSPRCGIRINKGVITPTVQVRTHRNVMT